MAILALEWISSRPPTDGPCPPPGTIMVPGASSDDWRAAQPEDVAIAHRAGILRSRDDGRVQIMTAGSCAAAEIGNLTPAWQASPLLSLITITDVESPG